MQEFDVLFQSEEGELPAGSAIMEWQKYLDEASGMFGKKLNVASAMAWMGEVGLKMSERKLSRFASLSRAPFYDQGVC